MSEKIYINNDWEFYESFDISILTNGTISNNCEIVRIPHTVKTTPLNYFDESIYQMKSAYRKVFRTDEKWTQKKVVLSIGAAAHEASVYINSKLCAVHSCGYTRFDVDITDYLDWHNENVLVICVDSNETLNIPPFGNVIDYMTYGGIYRDVYLQIYNSNHIEDVFVRTKRKSDTEYVIKITNTVCSYIDRLRIKQVIVDKDNNTVLSFDKEITQTEIKRSTDNKTNIDIEKNTSIVSDTTEQTVDNVKQWDIDSPELYSIRTELFDEETLIDSCETRFGFREAVFTEDGFYLNSKKVKLRGLNRHQSFPYVGYAMPKSMQEYDAYILKEELGLNCVRTSHYPQSQYFIDKCDELGLLVFTEIPGWQYVGDKEWQEQVLKNTRDMVLQYRNHPSIILWGVRINESIDCNELYIKTNEIAHNLDDSRQTSGVRFIQKSSLLEDVYAYNDFSYNGVGEGCLEKSEVTSNEQKGYLISEYNGHMYPTKAFDSEGHRANHLLRHAKVMNAYYSKNNISGGIGWCMCDYNTHRDFGSGDRVCYHGVMDMYRNPKPAAYLYSSQQDKKDILYVTSDMNIGENPACVLKDIYVATNLDGVKLYKNDMFIKEYRANESEYNSLPHPPIQINNFVGNRLIDEEGFSPKKAEDIKRVLLAMNKYGMTNLPLSTKVLEAKCLTFYKMKHIDVTELYGKYIGNWGCKNITYRFVGIKNGNAVKEIVKSPMKETRLEAIVSSSILKEEHTYDVSSIRIRLTDDKGNILPFANEAVELEAKGDIEIIGPSVISLNGGMSGTYVRSIGKAGEGSLTIKCRDITKELSFIIQKQSPKSNWR